MIRPRKMTLEKRIARLERLLNNESTKKSVNEDRNFRTAREVFDALDDGWDPNEVYNGGLSELMLAAIENRPAVARALIRAGADVNHVDDHGGTALDYAMANGSDAVEKILLAAGAEIGEQNLDRAAKGFGPYRGKRNSTRYN
jgi:ankyrin repeat protein